MIDKDILEILVCPQDRTSLSLADGPLLARLNQAIRSGQIENLGGQPVLEPLEAGLVRQDKTRLYPVVDGIPVLLVDEAVSLEQIQ